MSARVVKVNINATLSGDATVKLSSNEPIFKTSQESQLWQQHQRTWVLILHRPGNGTEISLCYYPMNYTLCQESSGFTAIAGGSVWLKLESRLHQDGLRFSDLHQASGPVADSNTNPCTEGSRRSQGMFSIHCATNVPAPALVDTESGLDITQQK
ncbi:hypothetical protein PoB_002113200 [Plakobranchus ocellatus]|uniref:Uncharacterized protein n=1 Tax=Plakobranchus ocellatus TaxID=259542 RepID=A0AAV3ZJB0_9GAST|nr:hypothetical protein PoB_002113200 [Plakobranchus ocellatus]